jgi:hypothetical protein
MAIMKTFLLSRQFKADLTVESLKECQDLKIISNMDKAIQDLKDDGFLAVNLSAPSLLTISPKFRPWKDLKLHIDQSIFTIQHKDCGIWIDQSLGLPESTQPRKFKCLSIHIALSFSAISRSELSPWKLEEYLQYRYNQFNIAVQKIQANQTALRTKIQAESTRSKCLDKEAIILLPTNVMRTQLY